MAEEVSLAVPYTVSLATSSSLLFIALEMSVSCYMLHFFHLAFGIWKQIWNLFLISSMIPKQ